MSLKKEFDLYFYNFQLSKELIAQRPVYPRDRCRLLIVDRKKGIFREGIFKEIIDFLNKGDVLALNDTKVIKARIYAKRLTGARIEVLLLKKVKEGIWEVFLKPAKRVKINEFIIFDKEIKAKILEKTNEGKNVLKFYPSNIENYLKKIGKIPLPPYIKKEVNEEDYQTIYANKKGAIASPTAGLHFTQELIKKIEEKGIKIVYLTLHTGLGTFRPIKEKDIRKHKMDSEWMQISRDVAHIINQAKEEKRRIFAVGTTCVRALETVAFLKDGKVRLRPFCGETNLYIFPGYKFKIVDALITNFHIPYSTNLVLVSSFCGTDLLKKCYQYAIEKKFRFYSFGDAMLIY